MPATAKVRGVHRLTQLSNGEAWTRVLLKSFALFISTLSHPVAIFRVIGHGFSYFVAFGTVVGENNCRVYQTISTRLYCRSDIFTFSAFKSTRLRIEDLLNSCNNYGHHPGRDMPHRCDYTTTILDVFNVAFAVASAGVVLSMII